MNLYVVLLNYNLTILIRIVVIIHYYYHCCVGFFWMDGQFLQLIMSLLQASRTRRGSSDFPIRLKAPLLSSSIFTKKCSLSSPWHHKIWWANHFRCARFACLFAKCPINKYILVIYYPWPRYQYFILEMIYSWIFVVLVTNWPPGTIPSGLWSNRLGWQRENLIGWREHTCATIYFHFYFWCVT